MIIQCRCALSLLLISLPLFLEAEIVYVDAGSTPGGDGSSWETAYTSLQDALQVSGTGDEIHVAAGIYYPDEGTGQVDNDRSSTFQLKSGVTILGGFPTGGALPADRDPLANKTILSGDIGQNDGLNFTGDSENSYHVVNGTGVDETAVLDGFVVTAARANVPGKDRRGGGLYCDNGSSPTVRNCSFLGNFAEIGGGAYICSGSSPLIVNCSFIGNRSAFGGGLYNCLNSAPQLINCLFQGNESGTDGGAVYNDLNTSPIFLNCTFTGNAADGDGGAVYNTRSCSPQFTNCIIWNNVGNDSSTSAAASVANDTDSFPTYSNSLVANSGGSANWEVSLGIDEGNNIDADPLLVTPVDPLSAPTTDGDAHLKRGSPGLNAGQNPDLPTESDIEGNLRIQDLVIDMGAYEHFFEDLPAVVIYVDRSATGTADGSSWMDAFTSLQDALQVSKAGEEIHVAAGVYYPDVGVAQVDNDRAATFQLKSGVVVRGGFPSRGGDPSDRAPTTHMTILSGDIDQNDSAPFTNDSGNSFHVVNGSAVDETALLDGFFVTAGRADGSRVNSRGGGMFCDSNGSPTVLNCTFNGNYGEIGGGFYTCRESSPEITNCSFIGNRSSYGGALFNCISSSPRLTNCLLQGNKSRLYGGAIYNDLTTASIYLNCTFAGNSADRTGGAVYNTRSSSPHFINSIVWNNQENGSATSTGASIENDTDCFPSFANSLIAHSGGSANWDDLIGIDNGNNIDADPRFVSPTDPQMAPTTIGSQRLLSDSPALNAGDNEENPLSSDLAGIARIQESTIDMGAFEGDFTARYATFHPDLDPATDTNGNGFSNYLDYALGTDPLSLHDSQPEPNLEPSLNMRLLTLKHRVDVEDVFVRWEGSFSMDPGSWFVLVEGDNYQVESTSISGLQETTVLQLPVSPASALFYRQVFSQVPF